jgi:DNA-binding transcriptional MerR regulator
MNDLYSIKDVAKIFGLQESRLRYWAQTGFVNPTVRKRGRMFYTFRDLIHVRAAKDLLDAGLTMQKVRKSLDALREILPEVAYPASKLHICSDGETVVARDDDVLFEPETGQLLMDFRIDALSTQVADILALPTSECGLEIPILSAFHSEPAAELAVEPATEPVAEPAADVPAAYEVRTDAEPDQTFAVPAAPVPAAPVPAAPAPVAIGDDPTQAHAPMSAYRYFLQGCEAEERGDLLAAEAAYAQALALQPTLAAAHTNLGNLLYRRGDAQSARAAFERALELEPNQPEARYNLGNVLEDMGETELAIAELRRVCWTHPDFADAHYNLGLMLARLGGIAQAQEHLERYTELDRTSEWSRRARTFLSALG